jgi:replication initiator protein RepSA
VVSGAAHWRSLLAEVDEVGLCSHPIRLRGIRLDRTTGELAEGGLLVPCKDRRVSVCPSCSRLYQADAWQLVAAGIRGGKGVDPGVVEHPQLFVTLTAPSFGPVHRAPGSSGRARVCRPRRKESSCPHGVRTSCFLHHSQSDPLVGEPLCRDCFDYRGAVLWNAHVSRLWARTADRLYREIAGRVGLSSRDLRSVARLSYIKVIEFQRRGLVHLHLVVRADGGEGPSAAPPEWLDHRLLSDAVERAAIVAGVPLPALDGAGISRATWGSEYDVRDLVAGDGGDSGAVAAYVAKYSVKTADGTAWLAHPIRSAGQINRLALRPHIATLVRTAWDLGARRDLSHLRLRDHAHTLGYGGQFSSKSRRYSTTFAALREARAAFVRGGVEESFDYDGEWRYAGRGYDNAEADQLASSLFEAVHGKPT